MVEVVVNIVIVNIVYVAVNLEIGIVNLVIVDILHIDKNQIVAVVVTIGNHHD
ncbi:hypothetical protein C1645_817425 [Glomus cerebriforme]|uniref:Uncharacterized protein n=1 Tax=Glomus cerebriforme TaxID=658196 RepID=A0A397T9C1_9GLOM|nr:hypothetical protein C1645_817425 [Glomus cerebriforme]